MLKSRKYMNTIAALCIILLMISQQALSQENQISYLSQKLMLENSIRERVTDALDKLLDDIKFVVDVAVELEFKVPERTVTETQPLTRQETPTTPAKAASNVLTARESTTPASKQGSADLGLPLPGFETPEDVVRTEEKTTPVLKEGPPTESETSETSTTTVTPAQQPAGIVSKTVQAGRAVPVVKRQQVNIIMEDGVTPEIIENVRQVAAIASHYDRTRGDVISVMTASFKKREKQDGAEAVILKNIAEKIDDLERRQQRAEQEARIEAQKRIERQAVVRDSLRIQELRKQIADLQNQLQAPMLPDDQRARTEAMASARETELANLKEQLRESNRRLQELEMGAMETIPPRFIRSDNLALYIILGLFVIALLILLILLLVNRRNHQKRQELEWGYGTKVPMGPRPQPAARPQPQTPPTAPPPVQPEAPAAPQAPSVQAPSVDPAALKEEMKSIKQSVISMSVGQPDTASRVINEWLGQTKKTEESESEF